MEELASIIRHRNCRISSGDRNQQSEKVRCIHPSDFPTEAQQMLRIVGSRTITPYMTVQRSTYAEHSKGNHSAAILRPIPSAHRWVSAMGLSHKRLVASTALMTLIALDNNACVHMLEYAENMQNFGVWDRFRTELVGVCSRYKGPPIVRKVFGFETHQRSIALNR